jgi:hypothetical protein
MNDNPMRADDSGVAKVAGAIAGVAKSFMDPLKQHFDDKAKRQVEDSKNQNLSAAQHGDNAAHFEMLKKLVKVNAKIDRKQTRTEGKEARKTQESARKNINKLEAKVGTKVSGATDGKGGFQASYTKAAAPRSTTPKTTAANKPAAATRAPKANQKANPANSSRGGKK